MDEDIRLRGEKPARRERVVSEIDFAAYERALRDDVNRDCHIFLLPSLNVGMFPVAGADFPFVNPTISNFRWQPITNTGWRALSSGRYVKHKQQQQSSGCVQWHEEPGLHFIRSD